MKNLLLIFLLAAFNVAALTQQKKCTDVITKKGLIGIWQRDSRIIGNGLNQNFEFYNNGTFVLNLGNDSDDLRSIIKLNGKYRLVDDKLYFTIMSETVVDGTIEIGDMGVTYGIFQFGKNSKIKEIQVPNPKELSDPCYITLIKHSIIKINNEIYYKIK
jgi:hypothetical protein